MWLIEKNTDHPDQFSMQLPLSGSDALRRSYAGKATEDQYDVAMQLATKVREAEAWIACDCRAHEDHYPLMTVAYLTRSRTYYIKRLTGAARPNHHQDCLFRFDRPVAGLGPLEPKQSQPIKMPDGPFSVLKKEDAKSLSELPDQGSPKGDKKPALPALARHLFVLMQKAGLNYLAPLQIREKSDISQEMASIRYASEQLTVVDGLTLKRVLATHPKDYHSNAIKARINDAYKSIKGDQVRQGFLLSFTRQIKGSQLLFDNDLAIKVTGKISKPAGPNDHIRAPYLALSVIGYDSSERDLTALRSYAHPIAAGNCFMPVDSDFERKVLSEINGVRRYLLKHRPELQISILKPLFDIQISETEWCRPDFIVETVNEETGEVKKIIIEAMGFDTEEYHASKARTHPLMAQIAPVHEISYSDIKTPKKCFAMIINWIKID